MRKDPLNAKEILYNPMFRCLKIIFDILEGFFRGGLRGILSGSCRIFEESLKRKAIPNDPLLIWSIKMILTLFYGIFRHTSSDSFRIF